MRGQCLSVRTSKIGRSTHAHSCGVWRRGRHGRGPVWPTITLSVHQSTYLSSGHARTLSVHGQHRTGNKRSLRGLQGRECELACVVGCVFWALGVGFARSTFEREREQDRSIDARSLLFRAAARPSWGRGGVARKHSDRASIDLSCLYVRSGVERAWATSSANQTRSPMLAFSKVRGCMRFGLRCMHARSWPGTLNV